VLHAGVCIKAHKQQLSSNERVRVISRMARCVVEPMNPMNAIEHTGRR
jgi:hypothetical protein